MTATELKPEILPLGADGLLVRFATVLDDRANRAALAFAAALENAALDGVAEVSTALTSTYLRFDREITTREVLSVELETVLSRLAGTWGAEQAPARHWRIPCAFGGEYGPQLAEVATLLDLSEEAAVSELVAQRVRVLAIGFAPGQPYLGLLPPKWDIPRQTALTTQVPAGALVVAVRQLVHFTAPAPTGWRRIGQTAFRNFRPESDKPFPLRPGDEVSFVPVSAEEFDRIRKADSDGSGGARLESSP